MGRKKMGGYRKNRLKKILFFFLLKYPQTYLEIIYLNGEKILDFSQEIIR